MLWEYAPLLSSLAVITVVALLLSSSIRKHAPVYYAICSIPLILYLAQGVLLICGSPFSLYDLPVAKQVMNVNSRIVYAGYPLLVIIMYTGALDAKSRYVSKLLSIRKELSIISGFPVLTHSLIRIIYTLPGAVRYFTDRSGYIRENEWIRDETGVGISSFGYILGIVMFVIFMVLWITSFKSVHRRMGNGKWKKVQKWAYVLYAMLFIHSVTLNAGWLINGEYGGENTDQVIKGVIAIVSTTMIFASYLILRLRKRTVEPRFLCLIVK
jgi:DMSO/TMAO reductase YedYZ heme-binding membrane subunit